MGSASVNPQHNQHEIDIDNESLESVQNFTKLAFDVSPKDEVLKVILTNDEAREAFLNFLKSDKSINFHHFVELTTSTRNNVGVNASNDTMASELLIESYILPAEENLEVEVGSISENIRSLLCGERDFSNREILELLDGSRKNDFFLLALETLPFFVTSKFFDRWRDAETMRSLDVASINSERNVTIPEILAEEISGENVISAEVSYVCGHNEYANIYILEGKKSNDSIGDGNVALAVNSEETETKDYVEEALSHVDYLEINRILHSGSWLFAFIAAVENLPICVTLATASNDRYGFPLIYVNKYFEATTGYARDDIMGANCKFLQRSPIGMLRSEMDSVKRLSTALRNAEPVKTALTNFRKNGTAFKNLLAMKPVFDLKGRYQFVIGLQFDISSNRSSTLSLRMVDSLMNLLPNIVVF